MKSPGIRPILRRFRFPIVAPGVPIVASSHSPRTSIWSGPPLRQVPLSLGFDWILATRMG